MLLLAFCKKMYLYPLLFGHLRFFCHEKVPTTTFPYITLNPSGTYSTVATLATTRFPTLSPFPPITGCPAGPPICPLPINTPPFCPCIDQRGGIYVG